MLSDSESYNNYPKMICQNKYLSKKCFWDQVTDHHFQAVGKKIHFFKKGHMAIYPNGENKHLVSFQDHMNWCLQILTKGR